MTVQESAAQGDRGEEGDPRVRLIVHGDPIEALNGRRDL